MFGCWCTWCLGIMVRWLGIMVRCFGFAGRRKISCGRLIRPSSSVAAIDGVRAVCDEEIRYSLRKVSANLSNKEHAPRCGYKPSEALHYRALEPTQHHRAPKMGRLASECARFSRQIRQKPAFHDNNVRVQVTTRSGQLQQRVLMGYWTGSSPETNSLMSFTDIPAV